VVALRFDRLVGAEDLLRSRWQNTIILCLAAENPLRYVELGRALADYTGAHPSEGVLTRTLVRLAEDGLVRSDVVEDHKVYTLTSDGEARARVLAAIDRAMPDTDTEEEEKE